MAATYNNLYLDARKRLREAEMCIRDRPGRPRLTARSG